MEVTALLHKTNRLVDNVEEKTELLAPVAHALDELGTSLNEVTESVRTVSSSVHVAADENKEQIAQAVRWGSVAVELFKKNKTETSSDERPSRRRGRRDRKQEQEPTTVSPGVIATDDTIKS